MALARSKVTGQGQISVPASVRRKLGVGPGSLLEWVEENGNIVVRRGGTYSSEEIHRAVFGNHQPPMKTEAELKAGIATYLRQRHARD